MTDQQNPWDGPDGNDGERDEFWGNGSWEVIGTLAEKDLIAKIWIPYLRKRTAELVPWPFKDVMAHLVDLHRAREKVKSMDDVFRRLFWRMNNAKAPSVRNRRVVEKFMRH